MIPLSLLAVTRTMRPYLHAHATTPIAAHPEISRRLPLIIQGGMGVGVSGWRLARAVSQLGQLGVISGTAIDTVIARRLQEGDPGGHVRRAIAAFPIRAAAEKALERFHVEGGIPAGQPYRMLSMYQQSVSLDREQFTMLAAFVEVFLAKEGHGGVVGMNLLTKIQLPNLALLYGAMLAGVDYILMGAGIPREIPKALDRLALHSPARLRLEVEELAADRQEYIDFDPQRHWPSPPAPLRRPRFLPIIASNSLATLMVRKAEGAVDGFVIEGPTAGGHNAPPRGGGELNERGEPIYGPRDEVDLQRIAELGLPFWIAGGAGWPDRLRLALQSGAMGIQVGTLFAFCEESGITDAIRESVVESASRGEVEVRTDAKASPTGYPFKVVTWGADPAAGVARKRVCDLGYLRDAYQRPDGRIGYRCSSEPEDQFIEKGGASCETAGRKCLCNSLLATIGHGQRREGGASEPPLVTSGDDLKQLAAFLAGRVRYTAADVLAYLLAGAPSVATS